MNTRAATPDVADPSPPVLACLDRSLHAADVLAHALAMAGMLGAPLRVVQVIEPPTEANDRPDPLDWAIRRLEARDALNRLVAAVAGPDRATEIAVDLLQGRVAEEIRRESRRRGAGL
ncbi:MAG: universal stress protein, partial [Rhodobacteraceae bacterium]